MAELRTFIADRIRSCELQLNFPDYIQSDIGVPVAYPVHKLLSPHPKKEELHAAVRADIEDLATRFPAEALVKPQQIQKAKQRKAVEDALAKVQSKVETDDDLNLENF